MKLLVAWTIGWVVLTFAFVIVRDNVRTKSGGMYDFDIVGLLIAVVGITVAVTPWAWAVSHWIGEHVQLVVGWT